ncbi:MULTISPECIES: single-stranded DNA-binding protein [Lactobacillus]|uniref:Single-stranded DNA-binding protein n=1 Tax=Lactobacillus kullabergensis TaxID=1218493 RepID=A0A0F4LNT0_9LACO|nr:MULTISPECIES: single-stranded DNA-binding protein [Lactobacillus]AWM74490.1 single-stranded DNA-binding protein [Lactobacillus kullabergensis]KJY59256.1 Single-stranded DNA-binding protein [Lactobacillus kullabergensis]RMC57342.1 single-stranded DNA-binding protein [Lactobacillus sp. ESL0261]
MINRVVLVGRLTRDPELRTTGSGISVATFTLAVDRQYTNAQGERGADFISCVIWRKAAENFCNFTSKGSLVGIDGRIQTRSYDNKDGQRVYVTEVVVDNFALLESRKDREARGQNGGYTPNNNGNFGNQNTNNTPNMGASNQNNSANNGPDDTQDPFAGSGDTIDISDDDLPF